MFYRFNLIKRIFLTRPGVNLLLYLRCFCVGCGARCLNVESSTVNLPHHESFMPTTDKTKTGLSLDDSIQYIKGVGPKRALLLHKMGLEMVEQCLYAIPYRYEDRTRVKKIGELHRKVKAKKRHQPRSPTSHSLRVTRRP